MKDQLIELYEARIEALETELMHTRNWIYRHVEVNAGWTSEFVQKSIDYYIKEQKHQLWH